MKWDTYGRWTCLSDSFKKKGPSEYYYIYVNCECSCWTIRDVLRKDIKSWRSKSCWCLTIEATSTHWRSWQSIYNIWRTMIRRCSVPNSCGYSNYWWRWISVCKERKWLDWLEVFIKDMWERPKDYSLDRIDTNWNYCKENCRWATATQQNRNRRNNLLYKWKTYAYRADKINAPRVTFYKQAKVKWIEKTIEYFKNWWFISTLYEWKTLTEHSLDLWIPYTTVSCQKYRKKWTTEQTIEYYRNRNLTNKSF